MAKTQGAVQNLGPVGATVAANLKALRGETSYKELSERLAALGRPIAVLGLSRIESGARRVDVDDLIALALALEVSPLALLLPADDAGPVQLTGEHSVLWEDAWRWATGDAPLGEHTPEQQLRWLARNRRHDIARLVDALIEAGERAEGYTVERDECGRVTNVTGRVKGVRRLPDGRAEEYEETRQIDVERQVRLLLQHHGRS